MAQPRLSADVEVDAGAKTFASGLLIDLVAALQRAPAGGLVAITARDASEIERDLDAWSRVTGHAVVSRTSDGRGIRWVIRHGALDATEPDARPIGERLWLYLNFDCNLQCDYCCVRSSPAAPRRALGRDAVARIARDAPPLGVRRFFVTGGEPFLLPDIDDLVMLLADASPVTVLTNGMLFRGSRLARLRRLSRERVTLQISLDSPEPALHDAHRGPGAWARAVEGIEIARSEGFRVRLAATVSTDRDEQRFVEFLDRSGIAADDRVVRRVALRGFANAGVALARRELVPEITVTAEGIYWHPVGAEDEDLLVTGDIFPLADAFDAVRREAERERGHAGRLAAVFHCA
jgi:pyruvate-formate lyase-activating enzyme